MFNEHLMNPIHIEHQHQQQQEQQQQQAQQQQQQREPNRVQQQLPDWVHEQGNQAALIRAELTPPLSPPFVAIRRANGILIAGYMDGDEPIYLSTEMGSSSDDDGK